MGKQMYLVIKINQLMFLFPPVLPIGYVLPMEPGHPLKQSTPVWHLFVQNPPRIKCLCISTSVKRHNYLYSCNLQILYSTSKKITVCFASAFPLLTFDVGLNMTTLISQQNETNSFKSLRGKGFL